MAVDFLNIPGDIRQQYMPFSISGPGKQQLFTYKPLADFGNKATIHPFSKHFATLIANDSSFQYTHGPTGKKIEYDEFLDLIPGIQIREYVPDAKLTQTFKWLSYFSKGFDASLKNLDSVAAGGFEGVKNLVESAWKNLSENMKGLTSGSAPILAKVVGGLVEYYQDRGFNVGADAGYAVLVLPFLLYYRLTTTYTNNVYEIPYSMQNNIIESDGTYGWGDDGGTDFPFLESIGEKAAGLVKAIAPGLGSTLKINAMPAFSPTGSAAATSFEIHFDLINDSDSAAVNNFLLCHTLFGNNRWLQYGFTQTGASLYDVKLPGANRYFMCKGKFSCKGKGVFRTPSEKVVHAIVEGHSANDDFGIEDMATKIRSNEDLAQNMADSAAMDDLRKASEKRKKMNSRGILSSRFNEFDFRTIQDNEIIGRLNGSLSTRVKSQQTRSPFRQNDIKIKVTAVPINGIRVSSSLIDSYDKAQDIIEMSDSAIKDNKKDLDEGQAAVIAGQEELEKAKTEEEKAKAQEKIDAGEAQIQLSKQNISDEETKRSAAIAGLKDSEEFKEYSEHKKEELLKNMVQEVNSFDKIWQDLIKIPDVYSITLQFTSLIPDNFNSYMYSWRGANLDPIKNFMDGKEKLGVMEDLVNKLIEAVK